jgi:hypothetical protein
MTSPPSPREPPRAAPAGAPRERRARVAVAGAVVLVTLVTVLVVAQVGGYTPLDPVLLSPATTTVSDVWVATSPGSSPASVHGNSSVDGNTLLLNSIDSTTAGSATWTLSFGAALDLRQYITTFQLYVSTPLFFASNASSLNVSVGGSTFSYTPTTAAYVPWYYDGTVPVYVANASDEHGPPPGYAFAFGPGPFLVFSFPSSGISNGATVTIEVPAQAEIYVSAIGIVATGDFLSYVPSTATYTGLALLPVLAAGLGLVVYAVRRLWITGALTAVTIGVVLRLGISAVFLHPDIVTLSRYDELVYNFHIVNLQSYPYGLVWFLDQVVPASAFYGAGVDPSAAAMGVLLKLPNIVFDVLTFLLLVRLLRLWAPAPTAYRWALYGWLFNPMVVYFCSAHGLYESTVAFFLVLAVYGAVVARFDATVAGTVAAVLTILAAVVTLPLTLLARGLGWGRRVLLVALPVAAYLVVFVWLYHSPSYLPAYVRDLLLSRNFGGSPTVESIPSGMSELFVLYAGFGVIPSPFVGPALVGAVFVVLAVRRRSLTGNEVLLAASAALMLFYLGYATFYVQLFVWALPLLLALVVSSGVALSRGLPFVLGLSVLGLAVNYLNSWTPAAAPYVAVLFFALAPLPIAFAVAARSPRALRWLASARTWVHEGELAAVIAYLVVVLVRGPLDLLAVGVASGLGVLSLVRLTRRAGEPARRDGPLEELGIVAYAAGAVLLLALVGGTEGFTAALLVVALASAALFELSWEVGRRVRTGRDSFAGSTT